MHWTDQFASRARVDVLVAAITDPISGQPASKNIAGARRALRRRDLRVCGAAPQAGEDPSRLLGASPNATAAGASSSPWLADADDWTGFVTKLVGGDTEHVAYRDAQTRRLRFACYDGDALVGTVFLAPGAGCRLARLGGRAARRAEPRARRAHIGNCRPRRQGGIDRGATVCACFGVGANEIAAAVTRGCTTVAAVGEALQAGTNCGSCRAEIRNIIDAHRSSSAALALATAN